MIKTCKFCGALYDTFDGCLECDPYYITEEEYEEMVNARARAEQNRIRALRDDKTPQADET